MTGMEKQQKVSFRYTNYEHWIFFSRIKRTSWNQKKEEEKYGEYQQPTANRLNKMLRSNVYIFW